jgi:hypothetical protein
MNGLKIFELLRSFKTLHLIILLIAREESLLVLLLPFNPDNGTPPFDPPLRLVFLLEEQILLLVLLGDTINPSNFLIFPNEFVP